MPVKTGAQRHTHKYYKINGVWACALRNCTHFMPKNVEFHVLGKESICWGCGNAMVLDEINMQDDNPKCPSCSPNVDKIAEYLKTVGE